jgi:tetratricopeptide (TPR) repeat protein
LEPLRELAHEHLVGTEGETPLRRRHAGHFLDLAEAAPSPHRGGHEADAWFERLESEHDNLRHALEWVTVAARTDPEMARLAMRLACAMAPFWIGRFYLQEGRFWLKTVIAAARPLGGNSDLGDLLASANFLALLQGDTEEARPLCEEALQIGRACADESLVIRSLNNLAGMALEHGDFEQSCRLYSQVLEIQRSHGDTHRLPSALSNLGAVLVNTGDLATARSLQEQAYCLATQHEDRAMAALAALNAATVAIEQGDLAAARSYLDETTRFARAHSQTAWLVSSLERYGCLAQCEGSPERAARLWGGCARLRQEIGLTICFDSRPTLDAHMARARSVLSATRFDALLAEGASLTLEALLGLV